MRDEIKQRIKQRDEYSLRLTFALGALVAIAATAKTNSQVSIERYSYRVLLAAPLISIYFTTLILYSYRIHKAIALYLREQIEPELACLCGTPPEKEWETYYEEKLKVPGIRQRFFMLALWIVSILSLLFVVYMEYLNSLLPNYNFPRNLFIGIMAFLDFLPYKFIFPFYIFILTYFTAILLVIMELLKYLPSKFIWPFGILTVIYFVAMLSITVFFWKE